MSNHKKDRPRSLFEREMRRGKFREAYEAERKAFDLEVQLLGAIEREDIKLAELARKLGVPRSNISRDLSKGEIKRATLPRVSEMANALGADFIPLILPRDPSSRKSVIGKLKKVFAA